MLKYIRAHSYFDKKESNAEFELLKTYKVWSFMGRKIQGGNHLNFISFFLFLFSLSKSILVNIK